MPYNKKTGKKEPYTKANMKKAAAGKGGLTMKKPMKAMKASYKKK